MIGIVLATYSLSWDNRSAAFGSLLNSGRYLLNPEQRAKQIIKVTREADIEFCRGFWNLSEIPPPKLFCPAMEIYQVSFVPMCGTLTLESKTPGTIIPIPEPNVHGPPAPIQMRVLSSKHREGLVRQICYILNVLHHFSPQKVKLILLHPTCLFIVTEEVM